MKLEKKFKKAWVKALRSGLYEQGKGTLKDAEGKMCCLAVAGTICGVTNFNNQSVFQKGEGIKGISKVPKELIGASWENDLVNKLTSMNDVECKSFSEIADFIENNY